MIQGIFPVLPTPFADDDQIDIDAMRSIVQFALACGAHGVVFPGVASEYNFLTSEERGELMAVVNQEVAGRVPIIGGASAASAEEVIVAGQQAAENGIHHLMIMAPHGLGKDLDEHLRFFSRIAESLPDAEIILQNAPVPIGAGLDAKSLSEIVLQNESITYVKEETLPSGPVITELCSLEIPHLKGVLGGGGSRYLVDELNRGALGAIPAVELTDLHVAIYETHSSGQLDKAKQLYRDSLPLLVAQMVYRMRLTKYVLKRRGVTDRLHVRAPLPKLDDVACRDVDSMLADLENDGCIMPRKSMA
ncbi:MAG: dihydrodipicolinate synthase family protein [Rubripirellula sp.]